MFNLSLLVGPGGVGEWSPKAPPLRGDGGFPGPSILPGTPPGDVESNCFVTRDRIGTVLTSYGVSLGDRLGTKRGPFHTSCAGAPENDLDRWKRSRDRSLSISPVTPRDLTTTRDRIGTVWGPSGGHSTRRLSIMVYPRVSISAQPNGLDSPSCRHPDTVVS